MQVKVPELVRQSGANSVSGMYRKIRACGIKLYICMYMCMTKIYHIHVCMIYIYIYMFSISAITHRSGPKKCPRIRNKHKFWAEMVTEVLEDPYTPVKPRVSWMEAHKVCWDVKHIFPESRKSRSFSFSFSFVFPVFKLIGMTSSLDHGAGHHLCHAL